jgi:hypothetical protein
MPGGFASRFLVEAGFLILLGVGAGLANLRDQVIVLLLIGGWVLVALIEMAVWRAQARPAVAYVPPPVERDTEPEPQPEPEPAREEYPLRRDAGAEPSEEIEAYTRILSGEAEDAPPSQSAK